MAKFTKAYSEFVTRLKEINTILALAKQCGKPATKKSIAQVNSLCRSGVVLLSSHIEGYIEDLGEIALDQIYARRIPKNNLGPAFRYYLSRSAIAAIRKAEQPHSIAEKIDDLFLKHHHVWDQSHTHFANPLSASIFVGDFSNPSHKKIRQFFNRFGYARFHHDMQMHLTSSFAACSNMVDQVIAQRNKIAHGDSLTTGTPYDLQNMIAFVKMYCRAVDHTVGNWFRDIGCPIR